MMTAEASGSGWVGVAPAFTEQMRILCTMVALEGDQDAAQALEQLAANWGLETLEDVKFVVTSRAKADEFGIGQAWERAQHMAGTGVDKLILMLKKLQDDGAKLGQALRRGTDAPGPSAAKRKRVAKRMMPTNKPVAPTEERNIRERVALEAVKVAVRWAPHGGPASHLTAAQAVVVLNPRSALVRRIADFEPAWVKRCMNLWKDWVHWTASQGFGPFDCANEESEVVIQEFLATRSTSTSSCRSAWHLARWLRTHLRAPWHVTGASKPPAQGAASLPPGKEQATVMEPAMIEALGGGLDAATLGWTKVALAVAVAQSLACMRLVHIRRSRPIYKNDVGMWFLAFKGKSQEGGVRRPLLWSMALCGPASRVAAETLWDSWHQDYRRSGVPSYSLLIMPDTGQSITTARYLDVVRQAARAPLVNEEEASKITTYSLRRAAPTLADVLNLGWQQRLALGAWAEKPGSEKAPGSSMPVTYSGTRDQKELEVKTLVALVPEALRQDGAKIWEAAAAWTVQGSKNGALQDLKDKAAGLAFSSAEVVWAEGVDPAVKRHITKKRFQLAAGGGTVWQWVYSARAASSVLHIAEEGSETMGRCRSSKSQTKAKLKHAAHVSGIDAPGALGRRICPACLKTLSTQAWAELLRICK